MTEKEATELGVEVLRGILEGEPAPLGAAVLALIRTDDEVTLVLEAGDEFVVWDADAGVEVVKIREEAMQLLTRGLVSAYGTGE